MARPLGVLLTASLLVNVFAAGAIGGGVAMLLRQDGARPHAGLLQRPIRLAGHGLPAPDRQRFRQAMAQVLQDNRDLMLTARDSRQAAASLFVQPRFDPASVAQALDRAREADLRLRQRIETVAIGFAATLPLGEREILAQGLAQGGPLRHPPEAVAGAGR